MPDAQDLQGLTLADITSASPGMQRCLTLAAEAAGSDLPVLLAGESGTGKTLLARAIHNSSPRHDAPFVSFNAAAMNDTLLESQLFGHEKGAFTGAADTVHGKFELADGGSLFFDEIADMSAPAQAKILRAVEYGEYERLGAEVSRTADVRIISATNRPLRRLIGEGTFRQDLYYRLNAITLVIPPLRERPEDLPALIAEEFQRAADQAGKLIAGIEPEAYRTLLGYAWPGNLRELHRIVQSAVLFATGDTIEAGDIMFAEEAFDGASGDTAAPPPPTMSAADAAAAGMPVDQDDDLALESVIRRHIARVYRLCGGNKRQTARTLQISRGRVDRYLDKIEDDAE